MPDALSPRAPQNMFAAFANNPQLAVNDASAPTAKDDFVNDPEKLCTEIVVRDQANQVAFHYRVQDSPGAPARPHSTLNPKVPFRGCHALTLPPAVLSRCAAGPCRHGCTCCAPGPVLHGACDWPAAAGLGAVRCSQWLSQRAVLGGWEGRQQPAAAAAYASALPWAVPCRLLTQP